MAPARDLRTNFRPANWHPAVFGTLRILCLSQERESVRCADWIERGTAALPRGERRRRGYARYAEALSSSKKPRVLFGSTGMPGAMVVVKVIFLR